MTLKLNYLADIVETKVGSLLASSKFSSASERLVLNSLLPKLTLLSFSGIFPWLWRSVWWEDLVEVWELSEVVRLRTGLFAEMYLGWSEGAQRLTVITNVINCLKKHLKKQRIWKWLEAKQRTRKQCKNKVINEIVLRRSECTGDLHRVHFSN